MLSALPTQVLWLLLTSLATQVSSQPLTQYTCACPIYSTSTSSTSSKSISSSLSSFSSKTSSLSTATSKPSSVAASTSPTSSSSSRSTSITTSSIVSTSLSKSSTSSKPSSSSTTSSSTSKPASSSSTLPSSSSSSSKSSVTSTSTSASASKAPSSSSAISTSNSKSGSSSSNVASKTSASSAIISAASSSTSSSKGATSSTTSRSSTNSTTSKTTSTTSSISKTSTSTSSTSSASASATPTIDSSGYHAFPSLSPNTGITASSYTRLSSLLPSALKNARSISTHSWELGTLANALTEVYYPSLSPFNYDSSAVPISRKRAVPEGWGNETHRSINNEKRTTSSPPWAVLDVVTKSLSAHSWSGAPSTYTWNTDSKLSDYLSSSTSPVGIPSSALISGDGALGDPCSLGAGTWIAAEYFQQTAVQNAYANGRKGVDYAWAVGGQYSHLESGMRSSNGTLSQREDYFATWADMGYMIPPFLAYIGMATNSQTMLNDALSQWRLEASSMLNYNTMLFLHIPDWDQRPWATGNGWMLAGFTRVVASIYSAGQSGTFWSTIDPYESTVAGVFTSIFNQLNSQNLVPNYMLNTGDTTGDAAGTAMITAAYYRFRTLAPWRVNSWMDSKASAMFDAVVGKVGNDGWLTQVVNPEWDNGWNVFSGQSPEGQSFLGLMWAARTAAGV